jgi:hypothetical protein
VSFRNKKAAHRYFFIMGNRKPENWLVETVTGDRVYAAVNATDARGQHLSEHPDEYVTNVRPE